MAGVRILCFAIKYMTNYVQLTCRIHQIYDHAHVKLFHSFARVDIYYAWNSVIHASLDAYVRAIN